MSLLKGDPSQQVRWSTTNGIYMVVHNASTNPLHLPEGINLATGFESYVSVSRTFTKRLSSPYSDCIDDLNPFSSYSSVLFGYMKSLDLTDYNQIFCYKMCFQGTPLHDDHKVLGFNFK